MRFLISRHAQGTPEWKSARAGYATGSKAAAIRAKIKSGEAQTRIDYRIQLVTERLTGAPTDLEYNSKTMQWGRDQEPFARMAYEAYTGNIVEESGFLYLPNIKAGCSLDGMIDDDGIMEIKCPNSATHIEYLEKDRLPPSAEPQVLHNLWITGRAYCDFVSFDPRLPPNLQLFIKRIMRDEEKVLDHEAQVMLFLSEVDAMEEKMRGRNG